MFIYARQSAIVPHDSSVSRLFQPGTPTENLQPYQEMHDASLEPIVDRRHNEASRVPLRCAPFSHFRLDRSIYSRLILSCSDFRPATSMSIPSGGGALQEHEAVCHPGVELCVVQQWMLRLLQLPWFLDPIMPA